jgi:hypothetical protein
MGPSTLVMRKELNGYAKYGADGSADVVYEGEVENWTFQVPNVAIANATLAMSISADDHPSYAIDLYHCDIWANSNCVFSDQMPANHGQPFASVFNDWVESDYAHAAAVRATSTAKGATKGCIGGLYRLLGAPTKRLADIFAGEPIRPR